MKARHLAFLLTTTLFLDVSLAHASNHRRNALIGLGVGEGISIAGLITSGVLFWHYSDSQYVIGVWCDNRGNPQCCTKSSDGSINQASCRAPINPDPIVCQNNTYAQCLEVSYKNFTSSPSTRYTEQATSARLGTGLGMGLGALFAVVVFPALIVFTITRT
jgi:hypothetical protein